MASVELVHNTPLSVCARAVRTCWDSHDRSDNGGSKDRALVDQVGNKNKHASVLEHLSYNFYISDISRALLQELARHRISSFSVKSTRYTLKELKEEDSFVAIPSHAKRINKYIVFTRDDAVDEMSTLALEGLRMLIADGVPNDIAKFALPDAYKTELMWTINARSLQNFLSLRSAPGAMWEIRQLAMDVYQAIPEDHQYLFNDSMYELPAVADGEPA